MSTVSANKKPRAPRQIKKSEVQVKKIEEDTPSTVDEKIVPAPTPTPVPVKESEVDQVPEVVENKDQVETPISDDKHGKKQKIVSAVISEVEAIQSVLQKYQNEHKDAKNNEINRLIRHVEKSVKKIQSQVNKLSKSKIQTSNTNSSASGFQKPVHISEAVAQFTGWNVTEPRARVDVTNYICDYIRQNKLQKPGDGRVILADKRLRDLLDYKEERDGVLTYASIQRLLAPHYKAVEVAQ